MLPVLALQGPTASGKSSLAVGLAVALASRGQSAEIVNADSMLVYRGMDIGTAKPTMAQRRGVRHHLLDILEVTQDASVADFQQRARDAVADCRQRGVIPILAGGSALYMRAITDVFEFPGTDPDIRNHWNGELERIGAPALHAVLAQRSPDVAADILPGNGRRIVRALEVLDLTGGHQPRLPEWSYQLENVLSVGLELDRAAMDARIADRTEVMWAEGLIDEVRVLETRGLRQGRTASKALGYRQVLAHLDGECTKEQAREATVRGTRRFARKQLGWFRRDERITWYSAGEPGLDKALAERVLAAVG